MSLQSFLSSLPEVKGPLEKNLPFNTRLKWTLIILLAFFVLSYIPLAGLSVNALEQFEFLSIILGAKFGSVLSLGIGPIVTASIVLQLLVGSGLLKLDMTKPDGRTTFQGLQKVLTVFFIIFEAAVYVFMGGLSPDASLPPNGFFIMQLFLTAQLFVGGILIMLMDEVVQKYGFGSGVSLFIVAGVASQVMIRAFSPLTSAGALAFGSGQPATGAVWVIFSSFISGDPKSAFIAASGIIATLVIFGLCVYAQAMKVEIPLTFGRIRGYGIRWPLNFLYTSNIPVILVAALIANIQLTARLLQNWGFPIFGTFAGESPASGLVLWLDSPQILTKLFTSSLVWADIAHALTYTIVMIIGAVIFSIFWMQTTNLDAKNQAKQMMASGLQIPGFRKDQRVLETLLGRYILPLTIMGAIAVGLLAAGADLLGALSRGTGILLAVMIVYKLYEDISRKHMADMYPALRKMMGGLKC